MKVFFLNRSISRVLLGALLFVLLGIVGSKHERSLAASPRWTRVNIEVLPGEASKSIDVSTRSIVPVAILSSIDFDAATVNPASVRLADAPITKKRNGHLRAFLADVNGDGRIDLVVYVSVHSLHLDSGTTEALLTAITFDGESISGSQRVSFSAPMVQESLLSAAVSAEGAVSNSASINIRDSFTPPTTAKPYASTITVSGQPTVTKLTAAIFGYSHTFPDDVDILLVGPTGLTCLLMADCGGSDFVNNVNLTFDDSFPSLPDDSQITSGTYKPTKGTCPGGGSNCVPDDFPSPAPAHPYGTTLSVFNGTNPNGTWQLYVIDDSAGDDGFISGGWSLTLGGSQHSPSTVGLYEPVGGAFFFRYSNTSGLSDYGVTYGPANQGWTPVVGDWNGDGVTTIGLYFPGNGAFFLRDSNTAGIADIYITYGPAGQGWIPVVGDWDGNGTDTVGLYNPGNGFFYLRNSNTIGYADMTFPFGPVGQGLIPIVGDWDGDGIDTIGLYDPTTGTFQLRNSNTSGPADVTFTFTGAGPSWQPIVGDWDGDGTDTVGFYNPVTGVFLLRNSNTTGGADVTFTWVGGAGNYTPLAGKWR